MDRLERLEQLFQSVCTPVRTLEERIDAAIAEHSTSVVVDLSTGIIVRAKRSAEVLFGYSEGELKGRSIHDLVPPRLRENHKMWIDQYRHDPTSRTMGSRGMDLAGYRKDGREFPVEVSLAAIDVDDMAMAIATVIPKIERTGSH